jgi:rubrerythrin
MLQFHTFEDVLDFAILQEQAAQTFYTKLSGEVEDPSVQGFYRTLADEERNHEERLRGLKRYSYALREPDLKDLAESGYLDAMPIPPDITFKGAIRYALGKERSAQQLYTILADLSDREELEQLFRHLASQEAEHVRYFQKEYEAIQLGEN